MIFSLRRPAAGTGSFNQWLSGKLSRVTSSGDLIPEIDGLRFIAISIVIFHHLVSIYIPAGGRGPEVRTPFEWSGLTEQSWLIPLAYCGHFGVHLFFVISGFILALPFARKAFAGQPGPDLGSYYLRRVTRLEPPYVFSLLVYFFYLVNKAGHAGDLLPHLLSSLFYSHGWIYGEHSRINGVTWSLEIEIQFYLLVPLLVLIFRMRRAWLRRALLTVAILAASWSSLSLIYPSGSTRLQLSLANFIHFFLTGFLLADFYLDRPRLLRNKSFIWDGVTIISTASIAAILLWYGRFYIFLPLLAGLLYAGFFLGRISNYLIRLRWIVITGGMCYTLYLYHVLIISRLMPKTIHLASTSRPFAWDLGIQAIVIGIPLFVICALLFYFIEKPFMSWRYGNLSRLAKLQPEYEKNEQPRVSSAT